MTDTTTTDTTTTDTAIEIPDYIARAKSLGGLMLIAADLLEHAEDSGLPAPDIARLSHGSQEVSLSFPGRRDTFHALGNWATRFGGTVTGEPYTPTTASSPSTARPGSPTWASPWRPTPSSPLTSSASPPTTVPGLGDGYPRPASQNIPASRKEQETLGMSHATSALAGGVVLDWRHTATGPPSHACSASGPTVLGPSQGRALPQGMRRNLDHHLRRQRGRPRPADRRLHPP